MHPKMPKARETARGKKRQPAQCTRQRTVKIDGHRSKDDGRSSQRYEEAKCGQVCPVQKHGNIVCPRTAETVTEGYKVPETLRLAFRMTPQHLAAVANDVLGTQVQRQQRKKKVEKDEEQIQILHDYLTASDSY